MEFKNLKKQYEILKKDIDRNIAKVIEDAKYISGWQVDELEEKLAEFIGVKHCITCANGTDALQLSLMAWGIGKDDIVFVPDFTFFASGEVVSAVGAIPIFVDVKEDTYNIDPHSLKRMIEKVLLQGGKPKAIVAVDLFGQPSEYCEIKKIAHEYGLFVLEDGAQSFGGSIKDKKACSFGDISTTSFFPAKPLGCYGDGGAVFTDNDDWASLIRSCCVHGKGTSKYDNIRIGMNSRLDTIQAAILMAKFNHFVEWEMDSLQKIADIYNDNLKNIVQTPYVKKDYSSAWAQYTIKLRNKEERDNLRQYLKSRLIPTAVYYPKPMHKQLAFKKKYEEQDYNVTNKIIDLVISIPMHPYLEKNEIDLIIKSIEDGLAKQR